MQFHLTLVLNLCVICTFWGQLNNNVRWCILEVFLLFNKSWLNFCYRMGSRTIKVSCNYRPLIIYFVLFMSLLKSYLYAINSSLHITYIFKLLPQTFSELYRTVPKSKLRKATFELCCPLFLILLKLGWILLQKCQCIWVMDKWCGFSSQV